MNYKIEELIPLTAKLAEKFTGSESTSITYEKAEQLMEAVLYCIKELEDPRQNSLSSSEHMSAENAYITGYAHAEQKVKKALALYNEMQPRFDDYGNHFLRETFAMGLLEFFRWYDLKFNPQNTILTLDYPVLKDLSSLSGIDKIYEYIQCLNLEQTFLAAFPRDFITGVLGKNGPDYTDMADNICEPVLTALICHLLTGRSFSEITLQEADYLSLQQQLTQTKTDELKGKLRKMAEAFLNQYFENSSYMYQYFCSSIDGIAVRLQNAAENDTLSRIC